MSNDFRPQRLCDIVGNEINNKLLLSIAKNGGCSTMIFAGDFGCGKTTAARVFAKALQCENLTDDICGKCSGCNIDLNNTPLYMELDSSFVGRTESIRELYEDLTFVPKGKKRVVVFDECHLISRNAMSSLLKLFEDAPKNIYYILCTTDKNAIIPAIVSRSLTLEFTTKTKDEVVNNIKKIANQQNVEISDAAVELIALRSKGHMRDAHKLYEKCLLIGEKDFLNLEESGYTYLAKYFAHVLWLVKNSRSSNDEIKKHKSIMNEIADRLMRIPIALLKDDYQKLFFDIIKKSFNDTYKTEPIIDAIVNSYDTRIIMNLYKIATDDFMLNSFDSDIRFQTALFSVYQRLVYGL